LVNLLLAINYHFGQLDPFGYRAAHIVIHLLSACLLWRIVARTVQVPCFRGAFARVAEPISFAAALVWALHPVDTESVVYVTQRTELTMGFFYLATLFCSIRFWSAGSTAARRTWLVLATLACLGGMLCKEMMASAPAMVLLYERTFLVGSIRRALRQSWPLHTCLALTWIPLLVLFFAGARTPGAGFGRGATALEWWFTQAKVIFLYLKLTVWPWPLVIHYEIPYLRTAADAWPWLLAAGLLALGTAVLLWRRSAAGFGFTWFFAVLSPTLVIPLVGETAAERRLYVPLAALVPFIMVSGFVALRKAWAYFTQPEVAGDKPRFTGQFLTFAVAVLVLSFGFGALSRHRLQAYRDELSIWQDAVLHQPHDPLVQTNLGNVLVRRGQLSAAIWHFQEAVRLDSNFYQAHYNLARAFEESARPQEAIEHYRSALKLQPQDAASHYNLARMLEDVGDTSSAANHYRQAIAAQHEFAAAHTNLGILLMISGDIKTAIQHLETALRLQPDLTNHVNLVLGYVQANRTDDAISVAEQGLELARAQGETALVEKFAGDLLYLRARRGGQ
jgi:Flp pilus assembly protein TadD